MYIKTIFVGFMSDSTQRFMTKKHDNERFEKQETRSKIQEVRLEIRDMRCKIKEAEFGRQEVRFMMLLDLSGILRFLDSSVLIA